MDQERWLAFQQCICPVQQGQQSEDKITRYKHDMEQAIAMKSSKLRGGLNVLTQEDVLLGMNGLESARAYAERREFTSALRVYESSLELLIKILGTRQPLVFPDQCSRSLVEESVNRGLASAEAIKEALQKQTTEQSTSSTKSTSSTERKGRTLNGSNNGGMTRRTNNLPVTSTSQQSPRSHLNRVARIGRTVESGPKRDEASKTVFQDFYVAPENLQKCNWDDIAGLQKVKQALQEAAILPLIRPDLFTGLRKPRNTLLYGPPGKYGLFQSEIRSSKVMHALTRDIRQGTGKTMMVKAVACESGSSLFVVSSSAITSKWMGDSEKLVKSLFRVAHEFAPSIIFIDEMDALLCSRKSDGEHEASRRLKTEFMVNIDGLQQHECTDNSQNVLLLACTNCPWDIDSAVLRRFSRRIYVPLPDKEARQALIKHLITNKMGRYSISESEIISVVRRTEGFSCSDISAIASEAAFGPIRSLSINSIKEAKSDEMRPVNIFDFDRAFQTVTKSVNKELVKKYDEWNKQQQAIS